MVLSWQALIISDKQDIVLQLIAKELRTPSIDIRRFERAKGNVVRALSNRRFKKPYKQTISELASLLIRPYWTEREQIAAARSLTTEDLRWFVPDLLRKVSVVALAHGNVSRVEALAMSEILKQQLCQKAMPESVPNGRVIKLKAGGSSVRQLQIDHPDSAVAVYFQGVDKRDHNKAQFSLLTHLVSAPFYQELRTERQLGYVVFSTPMSLLGTPGITFVVQSPSVDPLTLEQHVQEFITHYKATLEVMTAEQFEHHKENAVYHLLQKEDTLKERSNRYWRAINREDYDFDSRARIAKVLGKITKKEFTEFYHNSLIANNRKRLVVRSVGTGHEIPLPLRNKEVNREIIVDRNVFAKDRDYFS
jgi:insulysin